MISHLPNRAPVDGPRTPPLIPEGANAVGSRGAILREALALFAEKGYGATTVRDIATRVGMLSGSLYSHFPSKEQILAELVHLGHADHSRRLRTALLASAPGPREQLISVMRAHVLFHTEFTTLAIVANAEVHVLDPALAQPALDLRARNLELLRDVVQRGVDLGEFEVADVLLTAIVLGSLGARVANWYTPDFHLSAEQLADELARVACRIVGARDARRSARAKRMR